MKSDIIQRLESLGYTKCDNDDWVLEMLIEKVENQIKTECNTTEPPDELYWVAVDMVCGEFLKGKKASGDLSRFAADITATALKTNTQGDTSVTFATDKTVSPEERLDSVINRLLNSGKPQFARFRRLVW
jgi:hypothetical protein